MTIAELQAACSNLEASGLPGDYVCTRPAEEGGEIAVLTDAGKVYAICGKHQRERDGEDALQQKTRELEQQFGKPVKKDDMYMRYATWEDDITRISVSWTDESVDFELCYRALSE